MPRSIRVGPDRPRWLVRADLVTRSSNPDVLRLLAERDRRGAYTPEVCDAVGVTRAQAGRILGALEAAGLVRRIRTGEPGHGSVGQADRWFINRTAVAKAFDDVRAYVLDGKG